MVGNIPNFSKIDILRCFLRLDKNIGRQELAQELELGEGTIRTILGLLKSKKLIDSTKKGHFLSKKGDEMFFKINSCISMPKNLPIRHIYPELKKVGILVKIPSNLKESYKLRDIAVKNGAEGAIILQFNGKLQTPESDYNYEFKELEEKFELKNNDILIVSFSNKNKNAEAGALSIAVELSKFLKKFINKF